MNSRLAVAWKRVLSESELLVPWVVQEEAGVPVTTFLEEILVRMEVGGARGLTCHEAPFRAATERICESLVALINQSFGPLLQGMAPSLCVCACEVKEENPHYKYCGKWCLANVTNPTE